MQTCVCLHMCVCVHACALVNMGVVDYTNTGERVFMGRPEIDIRYLCQSLSISFSSPGSLTSSGAHLFTWGDWPVSFRDLSVCLPTQR